MCEEFTYTLTEAEYATALRRTRRKAGPVRLTVQTVLLVVLAGAFCADFAIKRQGGSLFIGIVLAVLAAGQWLFPAIAFRREARELAAAARPVCLAVSEQSLCVGEFAQSLAECELVAAADGLLLWKIDRTQTVAIPRRALSAAAWEMLKSRADT